MTCIRTSVFELKEQGLQRQRSDSESRERIKREHEIVCRGGELNLLSHSRKCVQL